MHICLIYHCNWYTFKQAILQNDKYMNAAIAIFLVLRKSMNWEELSPVIRESEALCCHSRWKASQTYASLTMMGFRFFNESYQKKSWGPATLCWLQYVRPSTIGVVGGCFMTLSGPSRPLLSYSHHMVWQVPKNTSLFQSTISITTVYEGYPNSYLMHWGH